MPGVQLGTIEVVRINEANFVSEPERELRRRIEEAGDQAAVLRDEVATAQNQLKMLDSLAANPAGSPNKAVVDSSNLASVLGAMGTGDSGARKRVRDANLQLRTLDRQMEQLKADLAKVGTKSKQSTEVRAAVLASTPVTTEVAVSYKVGEAGWEWIQARLDTAKKHLVLDRQGSVTQATGEDWKDVELTLTTASPSGDLGTPDLGSLFVDLEPPPAPPVPASRVSVAAAARAGLADEVGSLQEVVVTGARRHSPTREPPNISSTTTCPRAFPCWPTVRPACFRLVRTHLRWTSSPAWSRASIARRIWRPCSSTRNLRRSRRGNSSCIATGPM